MTYVLNETGLAEIRADVKRFSKHTATNAAINTYADEAEQSMNETHGANSTWEIRASHSTTGNPVTFSVSNEGWSKL